MTLHNAHHTGSRHVTEIIHIPIFPHSLSLPLSMARFAMARQFWIHYEYGVDLGNMKRQTSYFYFRVIHAVAAAACSVDGHVAMYPAGRGGYWISLDRAGVHTCLMHRVTHTLFITCVDVCMYVCLCTCIYVHTHAHAHIYSYPSIY